MTLPIMSIYSYSLAKIMVSFAKLGQSQKYIC